MGISSNNNNRLVSEINVTPFVDVMLVLLVIFMVTAPILYQGVDVNLPKASSQPIPSQSQKNIIVTVNKEGKIYIEKEELTLRELKARVKTLVRESGKKTPLTTHHSERRKDRQEFPRLQAVPTPLHRSDPFGPVFFWHPQPDPSDSYNLNFSASDSDTS